MAKKNEEGALLKLSEQELTLLGTRIEDDFRTCLSDHEKRISRWKRYYQKFRNRVDPPPLGEEDASNFQVPMTQWHTMGKWAKLMQGVFGDDAEIAAEPYGPTDQRLVRKIGKFCTSRYLRMMEQVIQRFAVFTFRAILFGRSFAYRPYERITYDVKGKEEIRYWGPGFYPQAPDDILVPAEDAETIQDFSFVIRRYRKTPQGLLDGEKKGNFFGIKGNFSDLVNRAAGTGSRENVGEDVKEEQDEAEGVNYLRSMSARGTLQVLEWYGRWRMLTNPKEDAPEDDVTGGKRELDETELVVSYMPDTKKVISVKRLADMYPTMYRRRPFAETSLMKDGSYWPMGIGELLESIEDEASANHNLFTDAGELAVGPVIAAKPGSGMEALLKKWGPNAILWTEDPNGVKVLTINPNLNYAIAKEQSVLAYGERATAVTDQSLGRSTNRPNEPRTASGLMALLERGDVRMWMDALFFREDLKVIIQDFWELDSYFAPPDLFFRVTEQEAGGLFPTKQGGAILAPGERGGRFDFDIKFANSAWSKEADKQNTISLYQADLTNPLIATNPRALWLITNRLHSAFGDDNFSDLIPEPPDLGQPKNPKEEWAMALQDEPFAINPMDNDDLHIMDHFKRVQEARGNPNPDKSAINTMVSHIIEHQHQKSRKMAVQAITQELAQNMARQTANPGAGGLTVNGPQNMDLMDLHGMLTDLTGQGEQTEPDGGAPQPNGGAA